MPIKIELPAGLPRDLRDEFAAALRGLGPLQESSTQHFELGTALLILAAVSATADVLEMISIEVQSILPLLPHRSSGLLAKIGPIGSSPVPRCGGGRSPTWRFRRQRKTRPRPDGGRAA